MWQNIIGMVNSKEIINRITELSRSIMPENSQVILFGSQARGDSRPDSDWDLLILLNKDKISEKDHDDFCYPFFELGWDVDAEIHPLIYSIKEFSARKNVTPLFLNVEKEGIKIC